MNNDSNKNITEEYMLHRIKDAYQNEANLLLATTGVIKNSSKTHTLIITGSSFNTDNLSSEIILQHCVYQASVINLDNTVVEKLTCEGSPNQCYEYLVQQFEQVVLNQSDSVSGAQNVTPSNTEQVPSLIGLDSGFAGLNEVQQEVDEWINTLGVRYFSELTNLSNLIEEVGEVARLIGREYGEQSFKKGERPKCIKTAIADELADVLFIIVCLANQLNINLDEAFSENMDKKTNRDRKRHRSNSKLMT